ncbi:TorF family putative porin [Hyphomonas sp.]|uniref:TorF family putative porin n=1 Tax=Hyphomonas sp. TaxID=87 RepID=UPI0032EC9D54|tara:strand:+ start:182 stop:856 length:675 start_codon:yes stop_codon:yes gene_type:complete
MKTKVSRAGVALVALLATAGTAVAEGEWSGNVAITSDYVWRGISQSDEDPAIQGGFDYANGMFYAGTWASNVDFGDASDTNIEVDFYGGLAGALENGVSWDVGVIYYAYPDADESDLDFVEVKGALGYEFASGVAVGAEAYYDFDNENLYLNATAGYGFTDAFSADVSVGNYSFEGGGDYTNWSLGGTYSLPIGIDVDLRYWGTDVDDTSIADERVVLTFAKSL